MAFPDPTTPIATCAAATCKDCPVAEKIHCHFKSNRGHWQYIWELLSGSSDSLRYESCALTVLIMQKVAQL